MHLIESLAAGMRGAENGTVGIYRRGTSSRALTYDSFEVAEGAEGHTEDVDLDGYGRAVVFVNELVDCTVKDPQGTTVCEFVSGVNASAVEVISQSFLGTDYATGTAGASLPLTLQAVLDLLKTSTGTTNFNVLVGGVAKTIANALSGSLLYYNVKDAAYGALGDGSNFDSAAIQQAANAAGAAGGGIVFFPKGTYRLLNAITIPDKVSLLGSGTGSTVLTYDGAGSGCLNFNASSADWSFCADMTLTVSQATAGPVVLKQNFDNYLFFFRCHIGSSAFASSNAVYLSSGGVGGECIAIGCTFEQTGAANRLFRSDVTRCTFEDCIFLPSAAAGALAGSVWLQAGGRIANSSFRTERMTSGNSGQVVLFAGVAANGGALIGNRFEAPAGAVPYAYGITGNAAGFFESGNSFAASGNWAGIISAAAVTTTAVDTTPHEGFDSRARAVRRNAVTDNGAAITLGALDNGTYEVRRTNANIQTITFPAPPGPGMDFTLVWNNDHGAGGGNITPAGSVKGLAVFTVNANRATIHYFKSYENVAAGGGAGTCYWGFVNTLANQTL